MKEIIKKMAREQILKVNPYQPGKPIEEVKRELGLREVVKLASNENSLGPSPKAVAAVKTAAEQINRYPDGGCFYLKQKLSEKLGVNPSNLILGNGSDEVIIFCLRAFIDPGDEIVIARPTFLVYNIGGVVSGAEVVQIPMKDFRYDLKAMKEAIGPKTKAVFIANPDNPVGCYVTRSELDDFFDKLKDDVIVFIDEAYFEFAQDLDDYPHSLSYLNKKNVIITRTFSKAYGLSGLRIGYGIATEAMIDCLNRVREPFNVNSLAQAAALAACRLDEGHALFVDLRHIVRTEPNAREARGAGRAVHLGHHARAIEKRLGDHGSRPGRGPFGLADRFGHRLRRVGQPGEEGALAAEVQRAELGVGFEKEAVGRQRQLERLGDGPRPGVRADRGR